MDNKYFNLMVSITKAYTSRRKHTLNMCQPYGLYVGQPQILDYVHNHPGCTQIEIAEKLGISSASIAFSTKRLQKAGFLQKQINSLNMRSNMLYVTPEGEEVLKSILGAYEELNIAMFSGFTDEEIAVLTGFAERINQNLDNLRTGE